MSEFAPEMLHEYLLERAPRILRFDAGDYFPEWQSGVRRSFKQLLGLMPGRVDLEVRVESEVERAGARGAYREIRFLFRSEARVEVGCTLLLPGREAGEKLPLVICLQGHNYSARVSVGAEEEVGNPDSPMSHYDFARQAVGEGYAALAMDMRCFGERADRRAAGLRRGYAGSCHHAALVALLVGRTMVGERVWDVTRAIDAVVENFSEIDAGRIAVMGYSAGATVAYYAAAFDARISAVIASGGVSTYRESIGVISHCADAYVPNVMHYFEMADLAGLIVPRPLVVVAGERDSLFPIGGVRECFGEIAGIYGAQGVGEKCRLVVGEGGHQSFSGLIWPAFRELCGWGGSM